MLRFIVEKTSLFKHFYYVTQHGNKNTLLNSTSFYKVLSGYFEDITQCLNTECLEGTFKEQEQNIDSTSNISPLKPFQKDMLQCITEGKDKFVNYSDLFSDEIWYYIVDLLTPWSKSVILKSMIRSAKFNAMNGKAMEELYRSFIKKNTELVTGDTDIVETEDDYILLTYLNRGVNLPPSNNDELSMYMNETTIVVPVSIENYAASYFSYWTHHREV